MSNPPSTEELVTEAERAYQDLDAQLQIELDRTRIPVATIASLVLAGVCIGTVLAVML